MKKVRKLKGKRKVCWILVCLIMLVCMEDTVCAVTNKSCCENKGMVSAVFESEGTAYNGYGKKSGKVKVYYEMGQPETDCSNTSYQYVGITSDVEVPYVDASETNVSGGGHMCNGHTSEAAAWRHWFGRSGSVLYGMETENTGSVTVTEKQYKQCKYAIAGPSKGFGSGLEGDGRFSWVVLYKKLPSKISDELVDDTAPELSLSAAPSGKTAVNLSDGRTYGTKGTLTANATDNRSRPHKTKTFRFKNGGENVSGWIGANNSNKTTASTTYEINENGNYYVEVQDQLGNSRISKLVKVDFIDVTAPVVTVSKEINQKVLSGEKEWTATKVTLHASALDEGAGLGEKPYCFDGVTWTDSNEYVISQNGEYQIKIRDALDNEVAKSVVVDNFDRQAPGADVKIQYENGIQLEEKVWSREMATVTIQADDEGCGLDSMPYSFNGGQSWTEENSFSFSENGKRVLKIRDKLQNVKTVEINIDGIDSTPPAIEKIQLDMSDNNGKEAVVKVSAKDNEKGCGLDFYAYSFDGGKNWTEQNQITLSKPEWLHIQVKDKLGNIAEETYYADFLPGENQKNKENDKENEDNLENHPKITEGHFSSHETKGWEKETKKISELILAGGTNSIISSVLVRESTKEEEDENILEDNGSKENTNILRNRKKNKKAKEDTMQKEGKDAAEDVAEESEAGKENTYQADITLLEEEIEPINITNYKNKGNGKIRMKKTFWEKVCIAFLIVILLSGLLGFLIWYIFVYCKYKVILYGQEAGRYKRLGVLSIKKKEEQWQIEIPDVLLQKITAHYYRIKIGSLYLAAHKGTDIYLLMEERMTQKKTERYIHFYFE